MRISHFFIDRPIFAAVVSIVFVILGGVSFSRLPVAQYPEIAPPIINVSGQYPGASAEVVAATVVTPIEQQINGVENMLYMSSNSTADGRFSIQVSFDLGTNLDIAQVQVQNRVAIGRRKIRVQPVADHRERHGLRRILGRGLQTEMRGRGILALGIAHREIRPVGNGVFEDFRAVAKSSYMQRRIARQVGHIHHPWRRHQECIDTIHFSAGRCLVDVQLEPLGLEETRHHRLFRIAREQIHRLAVSITRVQQSRVAIESLLDGLEVAGQHGAAKSIRLPIQQLCCQRIARLFVR